MKLLALTLYKWKQDDSVELIQCTELSSFSFIYRPTLRDHIRFHGRLVVNRTPLGRRSTVEMDQNLGKIHSWVHPQGVGAMVLIDSEYPQRVALSLLSESVRIFLERMTSRWEEATGDMTLTCPEIEDLFVKYQNPAEADKLTKIDKNLQEVKGNLLQSMDDLLKRGESLDQLMEKSKDLSDSSLRFYRTAKKNNQCCKMY